MNELDREVQKLHGHTRLVLELQTHPDGSVEWEAVAEGEDFLDGDWMIHLGFGRERSLRRVLGRSIRRAWRGYR